MEATEPTATGTTSTSSYGGKGAARARSRTPSWQHRRLLSTLQRSDPNAESSASTATAAGAVHRFHRRVSLHGRSPLPKRHLRSRMSPLTRPNAAVSGSFLPSGRRRRQPISLRNVRFGRFRTTGGTTVADGSDRTSMWPNFRSRIAMVRGSRCSFPSNSSACVSLHRTCARKKSRDR